MNSLHEFYHLIYCTSLNPKFLVFYLPCPGSHHNYSKQLGPNSYFFILAAVNFQLPMPLLLVFVCRTSNTPEYITNSLLNVYICDSRNKAALTQSKSSCNEGQWLIEIWCPIVPLRQISNAFQMAL